MPSSPEMQQGVEERQYAEMVELGSLSVEISVGHDCHRPAIRAQLTKVGYDVVGHRR